MKQRTHQTQVNTQQQVQSLSPQQMMVVKLIELPEVELEERIKGELLENPALEEQEKEETTDLQDDSLDEQNPQIDDSLGDYRTEDDIPDYSYQLSNPSKEEEPLSIPFSEITSFYDLLLKQLGEQTLTSQETQLAAYLIGSLDDDGLLRKPISTLIDELAIYVGLEVTDSQLMAILAIIQQFDPPGIAARDLKECLLIQLLQKKQRPSVEIATQIISDCYDEFVSKHWNKIKIKLNLSEEQFEAALHELTKLNPRPGAALSEGIDRNNQQITPDFTVETLDNKTLHISLNNRNIPELRISRTFADLITEHTKNRDNQSHESKQTLVFVKQKIEAAQGFIDAIKQRQDTLLKTMQAIVNRQKAFFLEGDDTLLRPMILKDVAEQTGLDISTISRVNNSKYVQTNFGIYPLKFFFNESFTSESGEEMSSREIKSVLTTYFESENKNNPLTDDQLTEMLNKQGYEVARRTVAKYRQQLNIPVARLRK